jgi:hypothetical protein
MPFPSYGPFSLMAATKVLQLLEKLPVCNCMQQYAFRGETRAKCLSFPGTKTGMMR